MNISRVWAMPSKDTFTIQPIRDLVLSRYNPAQSWIEPYAGFHPIASECNDINPAAPSKYHVDALDFVRQYSAVDGCIFDPPYSPRQISESYKLIGRKASMQDTQHVGRLAAVKDAVAERMTSGGIVICCGWNSNGFGKKRGFRMTDLLIVAHGAAHNDTLITVEVKT